MLLVVPLLVFLGERAWVMAAGVDWCGKDYECQVNGGTVPHSMCNPKKDRRCMDPSNLMSAQVEYEILRHHNEIRASLSSNHPLFGLPIACPLRALVWDSVLADVARNWAMNCSLKLDPCRKVKDMGKDWHVEQNMQIMKWSEGMMTPKNVIQTSIGFWWKMMGTADGAKRGPLVASYQKGSWDSAFQMIWADTRKIGCGYAAWKHQTKRGYYKTLVCNYGPIGISEGTEVYRRCPEQEGKPLVVPAVSGPPGVVDGEVIVLDSAGTYHYPLKLKIDTDRSKDDSTMTNINNTGTKFQFLCFLHFPIILLMI